EPPHPIQRVLHHGGPEELQFAVRGQPFPPEVLAQVRLDLARRRHPLGAVRQLDRDCRELGVVVGHLLTSQHWRLRRTTELTCPPPPGDGTPRSSARGRVRCSDWILFMASLGWAKPVPNVVKGS